MRSLCRQEKKDDWLLVGATANKVYHKLSDQDFVG